jgi:hypothetical protein
MGVRIETMTSLHGVALASSSAHWLATTTTARVLNVFEGLAQLAGLAAAVDLAGSLLDFYRSTSGGTSLSEAFLLMARQGAASLVAGLKERNEPLAAAGARALAGLGGGLTPAGDDFIVGAMLAAWAGLYGQGVEQLCPALAVAAAPRTTTLSAAYLHSAAAGECIAHWHTLFAAQQQGNFYNTQAAVRSLVSIGHTSGADALAGFLAVRLMQPLV